MKTTKKKKYEVPTLTAVIFKTEQGFAESIGKLGLTSLDGSKTLEGRTNGGNWGGTSDDSWF